MSRKLVKQYTWQVQGHKETPGSSGLWRLSIHRMQGKEVAVSLAGQREHGEVLMLYERGDVPLVAGDYCRTLTRT